jgi:hypothetical protein
VPDIYFYSGIEDKLLFLCQLVQKILADTQYRPIVLLSEDNPTKFKMLSDALWGYIPNSFLPNTIVGGEESGSTAPILISGQLNTLELPSTTVLCNLLLKPMTVPSYIKRVILLIGQKDKDLQAGRTCYRFYQQERYPIKHFNML